MNIKLLLAIITITLALVFYTTGVFSERKAETLQTKHLILFLLGLVFDSTGTYIMNQIANVDNISSGLTIHQITGSIALLLMLGHLVWATLVLWRGSEKSKASFHKFSILVWIFWLIPYCAGIYIGITN